MVYILLSSCSSLPTTNSNILHVVSSMNLMCLCHSNAIYSLNTCHCWCIVGSDKRSHGILLPSERTGQAGVRYFKYMLFDIGIMFCSIYC